MVGLILPVRGTCSCRVFIVDTLGFTCSRVLDPAFFVLRCKGGSPRAMIFLHVDDLMVSTDGSDFAEEQVRKLCDRFPFGEWASVQDVPGGVAYCGKEIVVEEEGGEKVIRLRQRGFCQWEAGSHSY